MFAMKKLCRGPSWNDEFDATAATSMSARDAPFRRNMRTCANDFGLLETVADFASSHGHGLKDNEGDVVAKVATALWGRKGYRMSECTGINDFTMPLVLLLDRCRHTTALADAFIKTLKTRPWLDTQSTTNTAVRAENSHCCC